MKNTEDNKKQKFNKIVCIASIILGFIILFLGILLRGSVS